VRYRKQDRDSLEVLRKLLISGPDGFKVPLAQVATIEGIISPRQLLEKITKGLSAFKPMLLSAILSPL